MRTYGSCSLLKCCNYCRVDLPLSEFYSDAQNSDGHKGCCKTCSKKRWRSGAEFYARVAAQAREYRATPEGRAASNAASRKYMRSEKRKAYALEYKKSGKRTEVLKRYNESKKRRVVRRRYNQSSGGREKARQYDQERRARLAGVESNFTQRDWELLKDMYGGMCAYCYETNVELVQDHIEPISAGGAHVFDNIVPACEPCNRSKWSIPLSLWMYDQIAA